MLKSNFPIRFVSTPLRAETRWADAVVACSLVLFTFAVYSNVFSHTFLLNWDDLDYVFQNETIRSFSWEHIQKMFTQGYFYNYAPLHILSYAIDYAIWGLRPDGFICTNVILHALNGVLLYALLVRLCTLRSAAAVGAAFFLMHPVQVESVAWISERKNMLCMTFFLLSLHAFMSYRTPNNHRRWFAYSLSIVNGVAALLTKAAAVVIAPVLVLFDICYPEQSARRRWILDKVLFVLATAAIAAVTIISQKEAILEGRKFLAMEWSSKLYTMVPIVVRYIWKVIWPMDLSPIYDIGIREAPDLWFVGAFILLLCLGAFGIFMFRTRRRLFFWYATFFVALVPVLQIVPLPALMNDRYLYFPMLGIAGILSLTVEPLLVSNKAAVRRATVMTAAIILLSISVASHTRTEVWHDDISLWKDATTKAPKSELAWFGLGMSFRDAGRTKDAFDAYMKTLALNPYNTLALNNVGALYIESGEPEKGQPYLLRAIQVNPDYFDALMNLGISYRMTGELPAAEHTFKIAVALQPQRPDAVAALHEVQNQAAAGR